MKILVVRADRIGDLILSIPVFRAIKLKFPDVHLSLLTSAYASQILEGTNYIDKIHIHSESTLSEIIKENYTHAITLQVDKKASWIPFKARIPIRIGPISKMKSFILFNKGVVQKRSRSLKNEAEYNLELLSKIGINYKNIDQDKIKPLLYAPKKESNHIVIHPGMGGSALNLSIEGYKLLANKLSEKYKVVITFGPNDDIEYQAFQKEKLTLVRNPSISELKSIYKNALYFIGGSTGPMHIAAALGTIVIAIFSPIKVQSAKRWGPWGNLSRIIVPDVDCKQKYTCNVNCKHFNCVNNLIIDRILKEIK